MQADKKTLLLPILLITVGSGGMLTTRGVTPDINWVWTLSLAVVGLMAFVVGGLDKSSVVIGPFFMLASCLSMLRQSGRLRFDVEVPILVMSAGVLLLVARMPAIPLPKWIIQDPQTRQLAGQLTAVVLQNEMSRAAIWQPRTLCFETARLTERRSEKSVA